MKTRFTPTTLSIAIVMSFNAYADYASLENYQGKPASNHTVIANTELAQQLPWEDNTAFERTKKG